MFVASAHFYGQITPEQTQENNPVYAQNETGTYILKDIVVDGVKKYTPAQILRFTGLNKNESVEIPGQKISNAIKKLWESQYFSEVEVYVQSIEGDQVILRFNLQDLKELGEVKFTGKGIGKSKGEKLAKDNNLKPGTKITQNLISTLKTNIPQEYIKKGYADAKISIQDKVNAGDPDLVDWTIEVDKGKKIKISHIEFEGNESVSDRKLRNKAFKDTKQKSFSIKGILKPSRFIEEKYEADKDNLINYYRSLGFRDAKIVSDSVWRNQQNQFEINVKLNEGKKILYRRYKFPGKYGLFHRLSAESVRL